LVIVIYNLHNLFENYLYHIVLFYEKTSYMYIDDTVLNTAKDLIDWHNFFIKGSQIEYKAVVFTVKLINGVSG